MKAINVEVVGKTSTGRRVVDAVILADEEPQALPTSGAGIDGLMDDDLFAPFSVLFCLAGPKVYIANESGVFTEFTAL